MSVIIVPYPASKKDIKKSNKIGIRFAKEIFFIDLIGSLILTIVNLFYGISQKSSEINIITIFLSIIINLFVLLLPSLVIACLFELGRYFLDNRSDNRKKK